MLSLLMLVFLAVEPSLAEANAGSLSRLAIITDDLGKAESNLLATQQNISTIRAEMDDLKELKKELLPTRKRHLARLESLQEEIKDAREKEHDPAAAPSPRLVRAQEKLMKAQAIWEKFARTLTDIESRFGPLEGQLQAWLAREREYESLTKSLTQEKSELEAAVVVP